MGQVKTWKLPEQTLQVDFASAGTTLFQHEPIYIGGPAKVRFILEVKKSTNLSPSNVNCAAPSLIKSGAPDNTSSTQWSQIHADSMYPDAVIQGTIGEIIQDVRYGKYITIPPGGGDPLLWPWLKATVTLAQNTPACNFTLHLHMS